MFTQEVINLELIEGEEFGFKGGYELQKTILLGGIDSEKLINIFNAFESRGSLVSPDELGGMIKASREMMYGVPINDSRAIDVCGTGGDKSNTFNISTATALVLSGGNIPVAKHGNFSATSRGGSSDIMLNAGCELTGSIAKVVKGYEETGFCYMHAPNHHMGFRHAVEARKRHGRPTFFNMLGPTLNPVRVSKQIVGVSDPRFAEIMGPAMLQSGSEKIVFTFTHLADGKIIDEAIPCGEITLITYDGRGVSHITFEPEDVGMERVDLPELQVYNKKEALQAFEMGIGFKPEDKQNRGKAYQSVVALNAAIGFSNFDTAGRFPTLKEGIDYAQYIIESGLAVATLRLYQQALKN